MSLREQAVDVIGVPFDLGASCRGSRMGPDAFRCADLLSKLRKAGCDAVDCGDVSASQGKPARGSEPEEGSPDAKYLQDIVRLNKRLYRTVFQSRQNHRLPVVIGGDHSLAIGSVAGTAAAADGPLGVIWFDAHGDLNTYKTTPTGNIHGMSLAALLGYGHPLLARIGGLRPKVMPQHVVLIGTRSLDPGEQALIQETGIRVFPIREIDRVGIQDVMNQALSIVGDGTAGFHLSFDLDGLDPTDAPGVGTPVPHGVRLEEAHLALRAIREAGGLLSADFVELNPALDLRNRTARTGVDLICTLFGG